jgi:hypothetical protein
MKPTFADVTYIIIALILAFSTRVEFILDYPRCSAYLTLKTWEPPVRATTGMLVNDAPIK